MLQTRRDYGIARGIGTMLGMRGSRFPNENPKDRTPTTFTDMVQRFADDLEHARATLANTTPQTATPFTVAIDDLWFDINSDGVRERGEEVSFQLTQVALDQRTRRGLEKSEFPVEIRFDGADHAWLMAYTHMLSGLAEGILAFDPSTEFAHLQDAEVALANAPTIPYTYDSDAILLEITALEVEQEQLEEQEKQINGEFSLFSEQLSDLKKKKKDAPETADITALEQEILTTSEQRQDAQIRLGETRRQKRFIRSEIRANQSKLPPELLSESDARRNRQLRRRLEQSLNQELMDTVYAVIQTLRKNPDRDRIASMRSHWDEMLRQNQVFWDAVLQETDNDREWLPNPDQTGALGVSIDAQTISAWQSILDDAQGVLEGRLLVPHPLLPEGYGINVSAWLDDPGPIDLIAWIHGRAVSKYVAKGPLITQSNWLAFRRLARGNARGLAFYFN